MKIESNCSELLVERESLLSDYSKGREIADRADRRVALFGGSSVEPQSAYYKMAQSFANAIASEGISVITGGGPGIMEAGNKGASSVESNRVLSYGIRVRTIIGETAASPCFQKGYEFETLSLRLLSLISACDVAVFFPGGFGTLEEMFSLLVRIRINMMRKIPVYLFDGKFWDQLIKWMESVLVKENVIEKQDMQLFVVVDDIKSLSQQVIQHISSLSG